MVGSGLVIVGTGSVFLVTRFFYTWSNLVYGVTSGSILICTTTINCLVFIPQLLQWRQFEEEQSPSIIQMAKYFNSPNKSFRSMYSEEQIYHVLGENTSMKRLLTEKNAVIESLQEQVNNAKDKLVKLLRPDCSFETRESVSVSVPSVSALQPEADGDMLTINGPQKESTTSETEESLIKRADIQDPQEDASSGCKCEVAQVLREDSHELQGSANDGSQHATDQSGCSISTQDTRMTANSESGGLSDSLSKYQYQHTQELTQGSDEAWENVSKRVNYVSSVKLQEILKELSMETVSGYGHRCPRRQRRASHSVHRDTVSLSSEGLREVYVSLTPCLMRGRRGHVYTRRGLHPSSQFRGAVPSPAWCIINKAARNRCNQVKTRTDERLTHTAEWELGEATDDFKHNHPPSVSVDTELGHQIEEQEKSQDTDGLWMTTRYPMSDPSKNPSGCTPVRRSSHPGQVAREMMAQDDPRFQTLCTYTETDSSSSDESYCCCHRPHCDMCFQSAYDSSDSYNSETESIDQLHPWAKPYTHSRSVVNFNEDLQPTFV
ncbi:hypothetical protein FKM82_019576 [Ascaphus truei]